MINAEQILAVLEGQRFANFYGDDGMLGRYIMGDIGAPDREKVLGEITRIFRLPTSVNSDNN